MEAYKCDMCGTLYEAYDKNKKPYYMKINIAKNTAWEQHVRHIDLCEFTFSQTVKVQRRKHHKTRISKKWAKLYGYDLYEDIYEIHDMETENDLFETVFTGVFVERKKIDG